ncbi:hypothetical protein D3C87_1756970 [compost metagenome]
MGQSLVFGSTAGISPFTRVNQVGLTGGQVIGVGLQRNHVVFWCAGVGEPAVHDVPLVENLRFAVVEETRAQALHFVHGEDGRQLDAQTRSRRCQRGIA